LFFEVTTTETVGVVVSVMTAGVVNKGGRPRKLPRDKTPVHLEMPDDVLAGFDRWVEELRDSVPGGEGITRADLMRSILKKALAEHQASQKRVAKKKG